MQSYPMPAQYTEEMEIIPGGPKLPRTPQGPQSVGGATSGGRTPAPLPRGRLCHVACSAAAEPKSLLCARVTGKLNFPHRRLLQQGMMRASGIPQL